MKRVLIADDHKIIGAGLRTILSGTDDFAIAGEASNANEILEKVREQEWDLLVLDVSIRGKNGLDLIRQVKNQRPRLPVLILTSHVEGQYALQTLRAGASGYVTKETDLDELESVIRKVADGGIHFGPEMAEQLARELIAADLDAPHTRLTGREYQIFEMLVRGKAVTEIANELSISIKTVSTHKARIMEKMNLLSLSELIRYAVNHDLLGGLPDIASSGRHQMA